jgi:hypothetical protein
MALSFRDKEIDRLARAVASLTGETLTDAIRRRWPSGWSARGCVVARRRRLLIA